MKKEHLKPQEIFMSSHEIANIQTFALIKPQFHVIMNSNKLKHLKTKWIIFQTNIKDQNFKKKF